MYSFYHELVHNRIKTIVNKFAISAHRALILGVLALRSYLESICEYELHVLSNKTVRPQEIMVETTTRSDRLWCAIFCVVVYWSQILM